MFIFVMNDEIIQVKNCEPFAVKTAPFALPTRGDIPGCDFGPLPGNRAYVTLPLMGRQCTVYITGLFGWGG